MRWGGICSKHVVCLHEKSLVWAYPPSFKAALTVLDTSQCHVNCTASTWICKKNDQLGFQAGSPHPGSQAGSPSCTRSASTLGKLVLHLSQWWTVLGAPVRSGRPTPMACILMIHSWRFPFRLWLLLLNRNHILLHFMYWPSVLQPCWTSPLAPEAASWVLPDFLCGQWYCWWVKVMALHGLGIPNFFWGPCFPDYSQHRVEQRARADILAFLTLVVVFNVHPYSLPRTALLNIFVTITFIYLFSGGHVHAMTHVWMEVRGLLWVTYLPPSRGSQGLTSGRQAC